MDLELQGRVVLVVGGDGYIGSAVTERLRAEGADVVVASRHTDTGVVLDGADPRSVTAAVAAIVARHGRIDGLVVSAAPSAQAFDPARSGDPAQVLGAIDGKAMTFLRIANEVLPVMRRAGFGRVVVVSGQNAFITGGITTSARNAVTNVVAKNLADELAGTGVAVNVVNPGTVADEPAAEVEIGRGGESSPRQIADLVAFLCSPLAALSGESIAIAHRMRGTSSL